LPLNGLFSFSPFSAFEVDFFDGFSGDALPTEFDTVVLYSVPGACNEACVFP